MKDTKITVLGEISNFNNSFVVRGSLLAFVH